MKKLGIGLIIVFLGVFFVQNKAEAQSNNDAQRIVGIWKDADNNTRIYTFNADGTFSFKSPSGEESRGNYFLSGTNLLVRYTGRATFRHVIGCYISPDGKILVIEVTNDSYWFEKQ